MKIISNIFRILTGIVFVFSGFVKVVDPLGVKYKFNDYFLAMGLEFLEPAALTFGILLAIAELIIGISLLFNIKPKLGAWGVLLFMTIFLPLTLWIAIANPVHDCGCFGDALVISNWATFWKNVVLMFMTVVIFLNRRKFKPSLPEGAQWLSGIIVTGFVVWLSVFCLNHLPVMDFRPYSIGENIREGMEVPESEQENVPVYETTLIYENKNTGETQEFDLDNIPGDDEWEWVETKNELIEEGYVPPIHDFSITTLPVTKVVEEEEVEIIDPASLYEVHFEFENNGEIEEFFIDNLPGSDWMYVGITSDNNVKAENIGLIYERDGETAEFTLFDLPDESWMFIDATYYNDVAEMEPMEETIPEDVTDLVLADQGYSFFLVSYDITRASMKNKDMINQVYEFASANDMSFYCLTASTELDVLKYIEKTEAMYSFYNTDPITLKTIVRSNPGLVLIKEGTVLNKWHINDVPEVEELNRQLMAMSMEQQVEKSNRYLAWMFILGLMLAFTALFLLIKYLKQKRIIVDRNSWN